MNQNVREQIIRFLTQAKDVQFGYNYLRFVKPEEIDTAQIGYGKDATGESMQSGENNWDANWVVIARDSFDDPVFVDASQEGGYVMVAAEDEEEWEEIEIADNLETFGEIVKLLHQLAEGRNDHARLKANPLSDKDRQQAMKAINEQNTDSETWYWEDFLEKQ